MVRYIFVIITINIEHHKINHLVFKVISILKNIHLTIHFPYEEEFQHHMGY